jgi:hypothetical protein
MAPRYENIGKWERPSQILKKAYMGKNLPYIAPMYE